LFNPKFLSDNGIPVKRIVQHPGELVLVHAASYHCGYNQGYNLAEAMNFSLPDWIPRAVDKSILYDDGIVNETTIDIEYLIFKYTNTLSSKSSKSDIFDILYGMMMSLRAGESLLKTFKEKGFSINPIEGELKRFGHGVNFSNYTGLRCEKCGHYAYFFSITCADCKEVHGSTCAHHFKRVEDVCSIADHRPMIVMAQSIDTLRTQIERLHKLLISGKKVSCKLMLRKNRINTNNDDQKIILPARDTNCSVCPIIRSIANRKSNPSTRKAKRQKISKLYHERASKHLPFEICQLCHSTNPFINNLGSSTREKA